MLLLLYGSLLLFLWFIHYVLLVYSSKELFLASICRDSPGNHFEKIEDLSPNMAVQV